MRRVPSLQQSEDRLPVCRLVLREEDPRPARAVPGERVRVPEEVRIKRLRTPRFGPHAPLLIRLVRTPYALRTGRPVRRVEESRQRPSILDREPLPNAAVEVAELRDSYRVARPMREIAHRPEPRPRPFERVREAAREARREAGSEVEPVVFDAVAEEGWI